MSAQTFATVLILASPVIVWALWTTRRKPKPPRKVDYEQYINSPQWRARKVDYYSRHPKRCRACDTSNGVIIDLHHHTYERLGYELDEDLVPLCRYHHKQIHARHEARGGSLTNVTFGFIHDYRRAHRLRDGSRVIFRGGW